jgi:hypothetical protein
LIKEKDKWLYTLTDEKFLEVINSRIGLINDMGRLMGLTAYTIIKLEN